ncbi:MAG: tetratricopeptide repeat protein [Proteobacteria bacterium]|nr:tetratricopeptide repeat protein [Pseudomonadota bacterium]
MTRVQIRNIAVLLLLAWQAPALAQAPTKAPAQAVAQAGQKAPAQRAVRDQLPDQEEPLTERQMALMEARILSRQGEIPKSLALYEQLRADYPDDVEVYEDYLETLVATAQYERVLFELVGFRKKFGSTSRSERIEAGLYAELEKPQYGLEILERAMRGNPSDIGLWSDLAVQRQASRDVNGAIQAFSHVLEVDPENQAAKDALHLLLLEKRPRFEAGLSVYDQGKKTVTTTLSTGLSAQTGDNTRLFLDFAQVHLSRPDDENGVRADVQTFGARIEHELTRNWTLDLGLQSYLGLGDGLSPMVGARYNFERNGRARASYAYHMPWYDQMDAVELSGSKDRLHLEYELPFRDVWVAYAGYTRENYRLSGLDDAGFRWEGTGSLTRRLWTRPDVYLTYTFQRAETEPNVEIPFELIRREQSHAGTLSITYPFLTWLEGTVSGGIKNDTERKIEALMLSPKLTFRPLERMRLEVGWDYASEGSTVAGGESSTYTAKFFWVW